MRLAAYYEWTLRYSEAAKLYDEILKSDIEVYGETDEKILESYYNLINVYNYSHKNQEMGDLLNRAVPIAENLPDDSDLKFNILDKQAVYYGHTGQFQKVLKIYEKLLTMPISNRNKTIALYTTANTKRLL